MASQLHKNRGTCCTAEWPYWLIPTLWQCASFCPRFFGQRQQISHLFDHGRFPLGRIFRVERLFSISSAWELTRKEKLCCAWRIPPRGKHPQHDNIFFNSDHWIIPVLVMWQFVQVMAVQTTFGKKRPEFAQFRVNRLKRTNFGKLQFCTFNFIASQ